LEEALECHQKELEGQKDYLPVQSPNEVDPQARLGQCYLDIGFDLTDLGRLPEARRALDDGLKILDALFRNRSVDQYVQSELARVHFALARLLVKAHDLAGADQHVGRAEE